MKYKKQSKIKSTVEVIETVQKSKKFTRHFITQKNKRRYSHKIRTKVYLKINKI